jgi:hypothetical protein
VKNSPAAVQLKVQQVRQGQLWQRHTQRSCCARIPRSNASLPVVTRAHAAVLRRLQDLCACLRVSYCCRRCSWHARAATFRLPRTALLLLLLSTALVLQRLELGALCWLWLAGVAHGSRFWHADRNQVIRLQAQPTVQQQQQQQQTRESEHLSLEFALLCSTHKGTLRDRYESLGPHVLQHAM